LYIFVSNYCVAVRANAVKSAVLNFYLKWLLVQKKNTSYMEFG